MTTSDQTSADQVKAFCSRIGADPLLVQGAGGNVSWKDGDVLWIKASGTWLFDAQKKDIFVSVDLAALRAALAAGDYEVKPTVVGASGLRPSIETLLHALMPQPVVVHVHAIDVLAHLVRSDARQQVGNVLKDSKEWCCVDYRQPGAPLAKAIAEEMARTGAVKIVFLINHGLVIGGPTISDVEATLSRLMQVFKVPARISKAPYSPTSSAALVQVAGYHRVQDARLDELAIDAGYASRLATDWRLCPDHVVFLGKNPAIVHHADEVGKLTSQQGTAPPFIFLIGTGVFARDDCTAAMHAQLHCYHDLLSKQADGERLHSLSEAEADKLLNWDAEKHRQAANQAKQN